MAEGTWHDDPSHVLQVGSPEGRFMAWFSREDGRKGAIKAGQFADRAVLSADYMTVPDGEIK